MSLQTQSMGSNTTQKCTVTGESSSVWPVNDMTSVLC